MPISSRNTPGQLGDSTDYPMSIAVLQSMVLCVTTKDIRIVVLVLLPLA